MVKKLFLTLLLVAIPTVSFALPAFPGAEGWGSDTIGGRGGTVYKVSNTDDSGAGSLRAAIVANIRYDTTTDVAANKLIDSGASFLSTVVIGDVVINQTDDTETTVTNVDSDTQLTLADDIMTSGENYTVTHPRTIIFTTGGTIDLDTDIYIAYPYVTIAGQTAPGDGIQIKGATIHVATHDVIIRGLRIRVGDEVEGPDCSTRDDLGVSSNIVNPYNVILDHNSLSWATDEISGSWYTPSNLTWSYNIISEPLSNNCHSKTVGPPYDPHGYNSLIGESPSGVSIHHNLYTHSGGRAPEFSSDNTTGANLEFINNVIYNWSYHATVPASPVGVDIIKNYYKAGPDEFEGHNSGVTCNAGDIYVLGNIGPNRPTDSGNEWLVCDDDPGETNRSVARTGSVTNVTIESATEAYADVLANAGESSNRDVVDTRILSEVEAGTGSIINTVNWSNSDCTDVDLIGTHPMGCCEGDGTGSCIQNDEAGWPTLAAGSAPTDTDSDGIPDSWEVTNFGDLDQTATTDFDSDGYTDIEEWINSFYASDVNSIATGTNSIAAGTNSIGVP